MQNSKRKAAYNSRFAKAGVLCFNESEVLNSSFVHLMKFSAKKPRLRKALTMESKASMENLGSALLIHKTVTHLYKNSSVREKQELVGSIFKDFLIYEGGEYRTAQLSILASLIFNDIKGFQESGIKKGDISVALSSLAPKPGLEPGTL